MHPITLGIGRGRACLAATALLTGLGTGLLASAVGTAAATPSAITAGRTLTAGAELQSADGHYALVMEPNGNLVEAITSDGRAIWASDTAGHAGASAALRPSGTLVVDAADGTQLWSDGSTVSGCAALNVLDDGSIGVDGPRRAAWSTPPVSGMVSGDELMPGQTLFSPGARSGAGFRLAMQGDGNLVEYNRSGTVLWSSGTNGDPGAYAALQADGDLVVYDGSSTELLWSSHTGGHAGAVLSLRANGNVVLRGTRGSTVWSTHTARSPAGTGDITPAPQFGTAHACRRPAPTSR